LTKNGKKKLEPPKAIFLIPALLAGGYMEKGTLKLPKDGAKVEFEARGKVRMDKRGTGDDGFPLVGVEVTLYKIGEAPKEEKVKTEE